jgi:predicted nucleic acid-binding protein
VQATSRAASCSPESPPHRLDFDLEYVEVDLDGTLRLAIETGLTAYDASYLWLARYLPAELVTLDRQLIRELSP